jgi:hypothetical protein
LASMAAGDGLRGVVARKGGAELSVAAMHRHADGPMVQRFCCELLHNLTLGGTVRLRGVSWAYW